MDKVKKFSGMALVVDLGVENLGDFKFRSMITRMGGGRG